MSSQSAYGCSNRARQSDQSNFPAQDEPVKCLKEGVFMASASWAISRRARDRGKKKPHLFNIVLS